MTTHNHNIKYNSEQSEYTIKLKKRCKWCWLLLLLLLIPLILLIPLKKDIKYQVLNSYDNSVMPDVKVNFEYTKRDAFHFDSLKFFTRYYLYRNREFASDTTDADGIAVIKDVKYNVYQWLFRRKDSTRTYATSECFSLDTMIYLFKFKKENIVYATPVLLDFEFTVVDADDNNEPLPDALVRIDCDMFGITDSARSDNAGIVRFKKIPKCSNIVVVGSKYGWKDDKIDGVADEIHGVEDTLFLEQEKVIVKFFVKDLYSKKPLVNAHGQLFFESDPNTQIGRDAITNINGVAKGVFDDVHKIKKINIVVNENKELKFYNDSSSREMLGRYIQVEEWNRRNDDDKVIYLRPNPNPILFQDIDCKTKRGLPNIENMVTIKKADGRVIGPTKIISDSDGEFSISAGMGDKITIEAISKSGCPNEYISNTTTIVDALYDDLKTDANKRKIPLCKVEPDPLEFKNTDKATGSPLGGVTNVVNVQGGGSYTYISKADGTFIVTDVYDCEIISITASKSGYKTNNTTVNADLFSDLRINPNDRIIPLEKEPTPPPPPPQPKPCNEHQTSGGDGVTIDEWDMEESDMKFYIDYEMYGEPDQMIIYCGRGTSGTVIHKTVGKVSGAGSFYIDLGSKCGGTTWITIKIIGGTGTSWNYLIRCP